MPSYLRNKAAKKGRDHASLHTHTQQKGGYLVFDRSNVSLLPIINRVWGSAFPVWDIESVITAGTRSGYFESSHLLNHFFTGLGQRRKRPGISREPRQNRQTDQELRFNSPCPPSDSWPVHMYGHQARPQDYGWKYASGFFPKLNAERFHPPKQSIISTGIDRVLCIVTYIVLWRFLEEIKFIITEDLPSSWGTCHGIVKSMQKSIYKQLQIIKLKALIYRGKLLMD